ncbi:MAG: hypothetical protein K6E50_15630 [Lachnospiraceae bacterium]|nr:hypothetical protein [Lachnospiraceae bacterium]
MPNSLFLKIMPIIVAVLLVTALIVVFLAWKRKEKYMKLGELKNFSYSPGYCDMLGESHSAELRNGGDGSWTLISYDRQEHSEPLIKTTYAVSEEEVLRFEEYLKEKKIASLDGRKDSDDFATDYSPWSYRLLYDNSSVGGEKNAEYAIREFRKYSDADKALLKELGERWKSLFGEKISEEPEE